MRITSFFVKLDRPEKATGVRSFHRTTHGHGAIEL